MSGTGGLVPEGNHLVEVVDAIGKKSNDGTEVWKLGLMTASGMRITDCLRWREEEKVRFKWAMEALGIDLASNPNEDVYPEELVGKGVR